MRSKKSRRRAAAEHEWARQAPLLPPEAWPRRKAGSCPSGVRVRRAQVDQHPVPGRYAEEHSRKSGSGGVAPERESELELENARLRHLLNDLLLQRVKLQQMAQP